MAEDITKLKIEVAVINEKLDKQSEKIDSVIDMLKQHIADEKVWRDEITVNKANKWVERFAVGLIALILSAFMTALIALVIE